MRKLLLSLFLLIFPLMVFSQDHSASLVWDGSTSPGVTSYRVYRNSNPIATVAETAHIDSTVSAGTQYTYYVTALDLIAESLPSNMVMVTIPGDPPPPPPPPPQGNCVQSNGSTWQWGTFTPQTGAFTFTVAGTPNTVGTDSVLGLSTSQAAGYSALAAIARFSGTGVIDARNGGTYAATNRIVYVAGETYQFRGRVDVPAKRYDLWVQGPSGPETQIAANYQFRSEQSSASSLGYWNTFADSGSVTWCNFTLGTTPPPPPQPVTISVSPTTITLQTNATFQFVAAVSNTTNTAVTWTATGGTITSTGLYTAPSNDGAFTVTARSQADTSKTATAQVTVLPLPPPPPPTSLSCTGRAETSGTAIISIQIECR